MLNEELAHAIVAERLARAKEATRAKQSQPAAHHTWAARQMWHLGRLRGRGQRPDALPVISRAQR